jgi:hypothetical protein
MQYQSRSKTSGSYEYVEHIGYMELCGVGRYMYSTLADTPIVLNTIALYSSPCASTTIHIARVVVALQRLRKLYLSSAPKGSNARH